MEGRADHERHDTREVKKRTPCRDGASKTRDFTRYLMNENCTYSNLDTLCFSDFVSKPPDELSADLSLVIILDDRNNRLSDTLAVNVSIRKDSH